MSRELSQSGNYVHNLVELLCPAISAKPVIGLYILEQLWMIWWQPMAQSLLCWLYTVALDSGLGAECLSICLKDKTELHRVYKPVGDMVRSLV